MKSTIFSAIVASLTLLVFQLATSSASYHLPSVEEPLQFYFTELKAPLRSVIIDSIKEAKQSLLVVVYQLRDQKIIDAIREKSDSGVQTYVVVDADGYQAGRKGLGKNTTLVKRTAPGIMHEKIIVTDKTFVYLGSTNFTSDSVNLHANDWIGMYSPTLAEKVWQRVKKMDKKGKIEPGFGLHAKIETRPVEMWFTPNPDALKAMGLLIDQSQSSIKLAMFTFTNLELCQKLINAKNRGVTVTIATDPQQSKNVNQASLCNIKEAREYLGAGLFHHKFAIFDDRTLAIGSLNWTKAAFKQNDDCFIIIYQLTENDQIILNNVWKEILKNTKAKKYEARLSGLWENGTGNRSNCTPIWPYDLLRDHFEQSA